MDTCRGGGVILNDQHRKELWRRRGRHRKGAERGYPCPMVHTRGPNGCKWERFKLDHHIQTNHPPLPPTPQVGECEHFKAMGQIHPKQACFILCGSQCK